jgi:formamidopyrimidine-DNA glycosylase
VPELPEVETVRRSLAPYVEGREVVGVEGRSARLRAGLVPEQWRAAVVGETLVRLDRRGKYLLVDFTRATGVIHLGMSGRLALTRPAVPCVAHTHLRVRLAGDLELRFIDPRRFGMAVVGDGAAVRLLPPLAALGVDALDGDILGPLVAAAARSAAPIRSLLLDQTVLAGLGNIYANEALARAGIHPLRRASSLARRRVARLAEAVKTVLAEALAAGGTTLDDGGFADAAGNAGSFAVRLAVYGREGRPCGRCGATIRRQVAGGRSVFLCPRCQR